MQPTNTIENEISGEIETETDLLQVDEIDESHRLYEYVERRQNNLFEIILGSIGSWQATWCIILSVFQSISTLYLFTFAFQTANKEFWCARPEQMNTVDPSIWKNLTQTPNSCSILDIDYNKINTIDSLVEYIKTNLETLNYTSCTEFEFVADEQETKTLVQEFGLVCAKRHFLSVVEMCFLAGAAIGSVCSGWLSDRFGRKHVLMGFAFVQTTLSTVLAFSSSLAMYMTLRVIIGFASMTVTVVSFVLVVELVSGKWRTIVGILNILPVAFTYVITAGIAYFVRDWRTLQLVVSSPWFTILTIWYCVPESPRWLLARGRLEELFAIVERAARMNGKTLPTNYKKSLEAAVPRKITIETVEQTRTTSVVPAAPSAAVTNSNEVITSDASPLLVVFNKTYWRTTCLNLVVWLTLIIIYLGLTLHLSSLGGNIYLNTAIAGTVEMISISLSVFVVLKLGIKRNLIAYMLIPSICCLATNIVPKGGENKIYIIALAMIAKCVIGANNAIIPTYTAMQYPTIVRNFGVGMGNLAAGIALILVPYIWLLADIEEMLPLTVMGVCGIIGAVALTLMKDVQN